MLIISGIVLPSVVLAQEDFKYVGARACMPCHLIPKSGAAYKIWRASKHANAMATLTTPTAQEIAMKKGIDDPQTAEACIRCHDTSGFAAAEFAQPFKTSEGVGCEACHGPGSVYKSIQVMKDISSGKIKAETVGLVKGNEDVCVKCHNAESPTFISFNYAEAWIKIAHYSIAVEGQIASEAVNERGVPETQINVKSIAAEKKEMLFSQAKEKNTMQGYLEFIDQNSAPEYIARIEDKSMQKEVRCTWTLKEIAESDLDKAMSLFVDFVKENNNEIKTEYAETARKALESLSAKAGGHVSNATLSKMGQIDSLYGLENPYESIIMSELLFVVTANQQVRLYSNFRESGFNNISQNMGSFRSLMVQLNEAKTAQISNLFVLINKADAKSRLRGWQALERVMSLLDLNKLKEKEHGSFFGMTLPDYARDVNITFADLKKALTLAKNAEKDEEALAYANKVLATLDK